MATGNQNKKHGLDAHLNMRIPHELREHLERVATASSVPGHPVTPSDVARLILTTHQTTHPEAETEGYHE